MANYLSQTPSLLHVFLELGNAKGAPTLRRHSSEQHHTEPTTPAVICLQSQRHNVFRIPHHS